MNSDSEQEPTRDTVAARDVAGTEPPPDGDEAAVELPTVDDFIRANGEGVIKNSVIAAMAIGLVPVPALDIVGVTGVSTAMIRSLCICYEVPFSDRIGKSALIALVPSIGPVALVMGLSSLVKIVPGIGTLGGSAGVAVMSGAVTYALGRVFLEHFEAGGTMADFRVDQVRDRFARAFADGRTMVREMLASGEPKPEASGAGAEASEPSRANGS